MRRLLTALVLLLAAAVARAETIEQEHTTLGWQAEHASLVALVTATDVTVAESGVVEARCEVVETLLGDAGGPGEIVVRHGPSGHGTPWQAGELHLVFVSAAPGGWYVPVAGTSAVRQIPAEGPETRFAGIVSAYLATLADDGTVRDPERLRELLVGWLADEDPGVVRSAAIDLRRHAGLHEGLTDAQRAAVLDAYRAHPIGKASKRALMAAVAATRAPGSAAALLDTLELPGARPLRGDVADALVVLRSDDAAELTIARFEGATPEVREHLLVVLGRLGTPEGAAESRRRLADDSAGVRVQAAHALGLIARAVRAADPDARVEGRAELVALLARARTPNERKAATWALAQLDVPEAYAQLRRLADEHPNEDVRRFAARYLERPRLSLILR